MGEKEIQDDVDLMNKSFDEDVVGTITQLTDTEPEPEPSEELTEPEPEPPAPEPEPEPSKEPPEPPEPEPDERDKTISELRQKLADKEEVKIPEVEPEPEPEPLTLEEQDFIGDTDLDNLFREPKEFNKLLNKVFHQGVDTTRKVLGEGVLRAIPDIVRANVDAMARLQEASDKFYKENEDLKPFEKVVAAVFEELASESPGKGYDELLPSVSTEVRNRLELHRKAADDNKDKSPRRLPRNKGRSTPKDKPLTNSLMKELEDMNESLGR